MTDEEREQMKAAMIAEMEIRLAVVTTMQEKTAESVGLISTDTKEHLDRIEAETKTALEGFSGKGDPNAPPPGPVDGETGDPMCGYKSHGAWIKDAVKAQEGGVYPEKFQRYIKMAEEHAAQQRAAGTGFVVEDDEFGGYIIPEQFRSQMWTRAVEISNIMSKVFVMPVTSPSLTVPAMGGYDRSGGLLYGGIRFYDEGENDSTTETRPKFEQVKFELGLQMAMTHASDKMMRFSPITMETFIREKFAEALAWRIEYLLINGSGAQQPQGVIDAGCTKTATAETGQGAATFVFENVAEMDIHMWRDNNAEWYYNREVRKQFRLMALAIGTGGSRVDWQEELVYPHFANEHCQALGTEGDVILADWSQYGVILPQGQNQTPIFDTSIHFKFDVAQTSFRFLFYMDGKPMWRTTETPRHGSYTPAPFVTLNSTRT